MSAATPKQVSLLDPFAEGPVRASWRLRELRRLRKRKAAAVRLLRRARRLKGQNVRTGAR